MSKEKFKTITTAALLPVFGSQWDKTERELNLMLADGWRIKTTISNYIILIKRVQQEVNEDQSVAEQMTNP